MKNSSGATNPDEGIELLRREDHGVLIREMHTLRDTFDVELVDDDVSFLAHRCVLAVTSSVLHQMFTNGMRESKEQKRQ